MTTVGASEATKKLSELLDRVGQGEEIVITRDGKPAARLVPAEAVPKPAAKKATAEEIRAISREFRALVEGRVFPAAAADKGRIDLERLRAVADAFKARLEQPFSSGDINDILYDSRRIAKVIVDSSAIIAILVREADARRFELALDARRETPCRQQLMSRSSMQSIASSAPIFWLLPKKY